VRSLRWTLEDKRERTGETGEAAQGRSGCVTLKCKLAM